MAHVSPLQTYNSIRQEAHVRALQQLKWNFQRIKPCWLANIGYAIFMCYMLWELLAKEASLCVLVITLMWKRIVPFTYISVALRYICLRQHLSCCVYLTNVGCLNFWLSRKIIVKLPQSVALAICSRCHSSFRLPCWRSCWLPRRHQRQRLTQSTSWLMFYRRKCRELSQIFCEDTLCLTKVFPFTSMYWKNIVTFIIIRK